MSVAATSVAQSREASPMTWGRRLYLAMLAMIALLAVYPTYNHFQIHWLERLRADITSAGGRAPRWRGGSRSDSDVYWQSLGGDLSRVVLRQAEFSPAARLDPSVIGRLRRCSELERLAIDGQQLDERLCRQVFSMRQLVELRIAYCELTDAQLDGIEQMQRLSTLDLRGTLISDASVERLSRLVWLTDLNLDYCNITPAGAARLSGALPHAQIHHRPWPSTAHRDVALRLFRSGIGLDVSDQESGGLVVRVSRQRWHGQPEELASIAHLEGIELLELSSLDLGTELLQVVAELPNVEMLAIQRCQLPRAELALLARSPSIRRLILEDVFLEHAPADQLAQCSRLESLALVNTRFVPGSLAIVSTLPNLRQLLLVGLRFRRTTMSELAGASSVRRLVLVPIASSGVPYGDLAELPSLDSLTLSGSAIGNDSVDQLTWLTNLRHLDVSGTEMTPVAVARLKAALPDCRVESGTQPIEAEHVRSLIVGGSAPPARQDGP